MPPKKTKKTEAVEEKDEEKHVPYAFNIEKAGIEVKGSFDNDILSSE